eukprot:superscaffoldBa00001992_g12778
MAFRRRNKSYPFFSQEFLIQNHADIVFSLVIFILIGLMFEATAKTAILFIQPQYNVTTQSQEGEVTWYHYGWKDCATILFYFFIAIILHAVVQEYLLDVSTHSLKDISCIPADFGRTIPMYTSGMTDVYLALFQVKFFYLTQLAYWLHALPELYFQKVRKEEISRQLQYICLYLLHISAAYLLNLSRVGLVLLFLQYVSELGFHIARLFYFTDESHQKM